MEIWGEIFGDLWLPLIFIENQTRLYALIYIYSRIEIRGVRFRGILFPFLSSFFPFFSYSHRETIRHYVNRCWFESLGSKRVRSLRYKRTYLEDKASRAFPFSSRTRARRSNENRAKRREGVKGAERNVRANEKGKKRYPVFHISKLRNRATDPRRFEGGGGEIEVVTILTYFRMTGLGLVSCLDASYAGYSIVTRASLKENKNSFAVLPLYSGSRNLCADQIVPDLRQGREAWILRKWFDRVWSRISPLISQSFVNFSKGS